MQTPQDRMIELLDQWAARNRRPSDRDLLLEHALRHPDLCPLPPLEGLTDARIDAHPFVDACIPSDDEDASWSRYRHARAFVIALGPDPVDPIQVLWELAARSFGLECNLRRWPEWTLCPDPQVMSLRIAAVLKRLSDRFLDGEGLDTSLNRPLTALGLRKLSDEFHSAPEAEQVLLWPKLAVMARMIINHTTCTP